MSDGLFIPRINFGPLYRAQNTNAQQTQAALSVAGSALDIGKEVYKIFESNAAEKARGEIADLEMEAKERWQAAVYRGEVSIDPETGELRIDEPALDPETGESLGDDVESWHAQQVDEIAKKYGGFRRVREWVNTQGDAIRTANRSAALAYAHEKAVKERASAWESNYEEVMRRAVAQQSWGVMHDFITSTDWMDEAERHRRLLQAKEEFKTQGLRLTIRRHAVEEGKEASWERIERLVQSGEITPDQGDALKREAEVMEQTTVTQIAETAMQRFQSMIDSGVGPQEAADEIVKGLPEAHREDVRQRIEAARDATERRNDREADETMQGMFAENYDNPAAMAAHFYDPNQGYSDRMQRPTYMYWKSIIDKALEPMPEGGGEDFEDEQEMLAWSIYTQPFKTDDEKRRELRQQISHPEVLGNFLKKNGDDYADPMIIEGRQSVENLYAPLIAQIDKEKNPDEWTAMVNQRDDMIRAWNRQIERFDRGRDPQQIRADLQGLKDHISKLQVEYAFNSGQLRYGGAGDSLTVNGFEELLRDMTIGGGGRYQELNKDNLIKLQEGTRLFLEKVFEKPIDPTHGVRVLPDGRPTVVIDGRRLTLRYDEAAKDEVVQVWTGSAWQDMTIPKEEMPTKEDVQDYIDENVNRARERGFAPPAATTRGMPSGPVSERPRSLKPVEEMTESELHSALLNDPAALAEVLRRRGIANDREADDALAQLVDTVNSSGFLTGANQGIDRGIDRAGEAFTDGISKIKRFLSRNTGRQP